MNAKRILITGWTGNTGSRILERAARRWPSADFVGVTRREDASPPAEIAGRFHVAVTPLEDETALEQAAFADHSPFDLILHVAHVHFTPPVMRLAEKWNARRVLLVHTTGMYSRYQQYGARYRDIDDTITRRTESGPCWTILRPTMIYGNARDHNLHKLILAVARAPVLPLPGDGSAVFQPVHVEDVADAALAALENPICRFRAYDLSGATVATYREMLTLIGGLLDRQPVLVPVPVPLALLLAGAGERLRPGGIGIRVEQVRRLAENKAYSHAAAAADFGFSPRTLSTGLAEEIALLRAEGRLPAATGRGASSVAAAEQ
ncbi:MAG: NAD-dependent epimerase/dehydratase family protein [Cytophagales bacterium]|nr:NAD-dependent epimerase/dehydratase family protein [Armatimonadota bacterium]